MGPSLPSLQSLQFPQVTEWLSEPDSICERQHQSLWSRTIQMSCYTYPPGVKVPESILWVLFQPTCLTGTLCSRDQTTS